MCLIPASSSKEFFSDAGSRLFFAGRPNLLHFTSLFSISILNSKSIQSKLPPPPPPPPRPRTANAPSPQSRESTAFPCIRLLLIASFQKITTTTKIRRNGRETTQQQQIRKKNQERVRRFWSQEWHPRLLPPPPATPSSSFSVSMKVCTTHLSIVDHFDKWFLWIIWFTQAPPFLKPIHPLLLRVPPVHHGVTSSRPRFRFEDNGDRKKTKVSIKKTVMAFTHRRLPRFESWIRIVSKFLSLSHSLFLFLFPSASPPLLLSLSLTLPFHCLRTKNKKKLVRNPSSLQKKHRHTLDKRDTRNLTQQQKKTR